jgi:hypothetical protein
MRLSVVAQTYLYSLLLGKQIWRTEVLGQLRQKVPETLSQQENMGMVAAPVILPMLGSINKRISVQASLDKK